MLKPVQITITQEQYQWMQQQPRGAFNLSGKVRDMLEELRNNEKVRDRLKVLRDNKKEEGEKN